MTKREEGTFLSEEWRAFIPMYKLSHIQSRGEMVHDIVRDSDMGFIKGAVGKIEQRSFQCLLGEISAPYISHW